MVGKVVASGSGKRNDSRLREVRLEWEGKRTAAELEAPVSRKFQLSEEHGPNLLFFGDNVAAMSFMIYEMKLEATVDFVYIDPPYGSQFSFESRAQKHAYHDQKVGSDYLENLRHRLLFLRKMMKESASICVHIDERMSSYVRVLLDEIFGPENFLNEITRVKSNPKNYTRRSFGNVSDRILCYSKTKKYKWFRPYAEWTDERAAKEYQFVEDGTGRRYKRVPIHAPGTRNGETGEPWRGMEPPPGKHWQFRPSTLDELDAKGEIYWSSTGNPRRKIYFDTSPGIALQDVWLDAKDPFNQNAMITGYPTEKNPMVLERLISAFTERDDVVLDCYLGSGTTADVAQQLGRKWIGIDESSEAIETTIRRLTVGTKQMGDFRATKKPEQPVLFNDVKQYSLYELEKSG